MYCPSCGAEQLQGLKYCNRCGANLSTETAPPPKLVTMTWALSVATVLVAACGFVLVFIFGMEFMSRGNAKTSDLIFLIFFLLVVLAISALLIRQLSRLISIYLHSSDTPKPKPEPASLSQQLTQRLPGMRESATSDSEQTTRKLETSNIEKRQ
jgi:hypothetical protein